MKLTQNISQMKTSTDKDNLNALIETEPEEFPIKDKDKNGQRKEQEQRQQKKRQGQWKSTCENRAWRYLKAVTESSTIDVSDASISSESPNPLLWDKYSTLNVSQKCKHRLHWWTSTSILFQNLYNTFLQLLLEDGKENILKFSLTPNILNEISSMLNCLLFLFT